MADKYAESGFKHPCAQTCSGYSQGVEDGARAERERLEALIQACHSARTAHERLKDLSGPVHRIAMALDKLGLGEGQ